MKYLLTLTATILMMTGTTNVQAKEADLTKGKALYTSCIACHQADGHGNMLLKAPSIAGQEKWYLETQLKNFKNRVRGANPKDVEGMLMAPMSQLLVTDEDIEAVAAYVSTLKAETIEHTITTGDPQKGKMLYMTCLACHGDKAQGNELLKSPKLTGQNDWYMRTQIGKFKTGLRGAHPKDTAGMTMRPMAMTLPTDQAINDVIAYIKTLDPKNEE